MYIKPPKIDVLSCNRCFQKWFPRKESLPKYCSRCKSPYWNKPRIIPIKKNFKPKGRKLNNL